MSDEKFVPITKTTKEMFKTYLFWSEKYLMYVRKVSSAEEACNNARTYSIQLINRGVDPESEILVPIKTDESLIQYYMNLMQYYLKETSTKLEALYNCFLYSENNPKKFYDTEKQIVYLLDIAAQVEYRCMKRRQDFVRRCLDVLNSLSQRDFLSMLL